MKAGRENTQMSVFISLAVSHSLVRRTFNKLKASPVSKNYIQPQHSVASPSTSLWRCSPNTRRSFNESLNFTRTHTKLQLKLMPILSINSIALQYVFRHFNYTCQVVQKDASTKFRNFSNGVWLGCVYNRQFLASCRTHLPRSRS